jgi:1,4-dihydroxy-2-naphthoate octaprenyltransferase
MENVSPIRKLNLIFRFSYTIPFFLASVCGVLYAAIRFDVPLHVSILIPIVVLFLALFVNFSNDYYDSLSGVDDLRFKNKHMFDSAASPLLKKVYWDGNPVNNGLVTKKQARIIVIVLAVLAIVCSIPIVMYGGIYAVVLGILGLLIAFFYTAPPVNLGARGLGELSVGISFFLMVFASFFVSSQYIFDYEIILFSLIIGIFVGLMRTVDSMSGQSAHIEANEKSISVVVGIDGMPKVIKFILITGYIPIFAMMYFDLLYAILLLTLPIAAKTWVLVTKRSEHWEFFTAPLTFLIALSLEILFIIVQIVMWI